MAVGGGGGSERIVSSGSEKISLFGWSDIHRDLPSMALSEHPLTLLVWIGAVTPGNPRVAHGLGSLFMSNIPLGRGESEMG
jgi:hypothetical protein